MSYKKSFFSGISWNGAFNLLSNVVSALKLFILYRILTPKDFGLFSLVLVSLSLIEVFTESGINTILVQSQKQISDYINTAWIFSLFRGFFIFLVMIVLAFGMSRYYQEPQLLNLILFASIIPLVRGCINPAIVHFYKELQFKKDTFYRTSLILVEFTSAVVFGFILKNTYALIIPILFSACTDVFISFRFTPIRPRFQFEKRIFKEILTQSKWLNNISIFDYLNKNLDNLIVGRLLGTVQLGFYQGAFSLTQSATADLGSSVIHASFPIYSRLAEDTARLRKAFLKVFAVFCGVLVIPVSIFVLFPSLIVKVQFGEQWLPLVAILPILALSGYMQGLFNIGSTLFTVRKKYHFLSAMLIISLGSMVWGLLTLTPQYGLIGSAMSVLISRLITLPFFAFFTVYTLRTSSTAHEKD